MKTIGKKPVYNKAVLLVFSSWIINELLPSGSFSRLPESFLFLFFDRKGEAVLNLLCHSELSHALDEILVGDLEPAQPGLTIENDAMEDGAPVLLCYFCDLPRIKRFHTALQLQNKTGIIICFDYQAEPLRRYCGNIVKFQTIDFEKWERRFFI